MKLRIFALNSSHQMEKSIEVLVEGIETETFGEGGKTLDRCGDRIRALVVTEQR